MDVPQVQPWIGADEYEAVRACFDDNWITEGPKAGEFRAELLKLTGAKFGEFAPNGTLAIYMALRAAGIGPGDEVIVPDFTFIATANAVVMSGATPVFVDVTPGNFQIDVNQCADALGPNSKAIMPAHMYGMISNMTDVVSFAQEHDLLVIEDAAQALGVHYKGQHSGTFGAAGTFSFFADKTITTGEGGFVITDDEDINHNLRMLRNQGREGRGSFEHPEIGFNFRMTDIQMAIGLAQLSKFAEIKERKARSLSLYKEALQEIEQIDFLELEPGSERIPFRFCILVDRAPELMDFMSSKSIQPRTFFYPLHRQPCFQYLKSGQNLDDAKFPNSARGYERGICLPIFPQLTAEQINYVYEAIKQFYS